MGREKSLPRFSRGLPLPTLAGFRRQPATPGLEVSSEARMIFVCVARKNDYSNVYREKIDELFPY
jgi:hypothetical protein